jgi:hypothetical protein
MEVVQVFEVNCLDLIWASDMVGMDVVGLSMLTLEHDWTAWMGAKQFRRGMHLLVHQSKVTIDVI